MRARVEPAGDDLYEGPIQHKRCEFRRSSVLDSYCRITLFLLEEILRSLQESWLGEEGWNALRHLFPVEPESDPIYRYM